MKQDITDIVQGTHCRSCGDSSYETVYMAGRNEGYTECCNKSLTDECSDRCFHLSEENLAKVERQQRW